MKFLSDEWFAKVDELRAEAGDLEIPPALAAMLINVTVTGDQTRDMHMKGGEFVKGHDPGAPTSITLPAELARKIFIEGDVAAGMQGFMAGEIKVEGDMSKLMEMQTVQPSAKQRELLGKVKGLTTA
jgi:putative sterol carrier protein